MTDSVLGNGGVPWNLIEWDIVREVGWTFDELDRQDSTRVIPALRAANIRAALQRVMSFTESLGKIPVAPEDLKVWSEAMQVRDEVKKLNG